MRQAEVLGWLAILPFAEKSGMRPNNGAATITLRACRDDRERISVLHDLLIHAGTDEMSADDVVICLEALEYLLLKANFSTSQAVFKSCRACHRSVLLTVGGHKEHVAKCRKTGPGRSKKREVEKHGQAVKRGKGTEVPELREGNRDGLEGIAEALPDVLPSVQGFAIDY